MIKATLRRKITYWALIKVKLQNGKKSEFFYGNNPLCMEVSGF